jgi:hypothetical protein
MEATRYRHSSCHLLFGIRFILPLLMNSSIRPPQLGYLGLLVIGSIAFELVNQQPQIHCPNEPINSINLIKPNEPKKPDKLNKL